MDENIKQLMVIAEELEAFKHKVYALLNKEEWLDTFIMNNTPCNYNIIDIIRNIQKGITTHKVTPCHDSMFHEIPCLEDDERYGFFKSEADIRHGHARWIEKECAERLYNLIHNENERTKDKIIKIKKIVHNTANRPVEFADSLNRIKAIINDEGG